MAEINVANDLAQLNQQLEQLIAQLNQMNTQRDQLTQQIHNLNGAAMYLRGKEGIVNEPEIVENLERTEAYPEDMIKET